MESGVSALFGRAKEESVKLNVALSEKDGEAARAANADLSPQFASPW
jgi:hypothetical protein